VVSTRALPAASVARTVTPARAAPLGTLLGCSGSAATFAGMEVCLSSTDVRICVIWPAVPIATRLASDSRDRLDLHELVHQIGELPPHHVPGPRIARSPRQCATRPHRGGHRPRNTVVRPHGWEGRPRMRMRATECSLNRDRTFGDLLPCTTRRQPVGRLCLVRPRPPTRRPRPAGSLDRACSARRGSNDSSTESTSS
jgi:hypothetical protein